MRCRRRERSCRAPRTIRRARCRRAPGRGRRRARDLKSGFVTRRRRMSSDCTSGIPALSSVASLLVEDEKLARGDARARRHRQRADRQAARTLDAQHVQALLLELAAEAVLAVGDVDAFDDLAARGAEPAAELHVSIHRCEAIAHFSDAACVGASSCQCGHYRLLASRDYTGTGTSAPGGAQC